VQTVTYTTLLELARHVLTSHSSSSADRSLAFALATFCLDSLVARPRPYSKLPQQDRATPSFAEILKMDETHAAVVWSKSPTKGSQQHVEKDDEATIADAKQMDRNWVSRQDVEKSANVLLVACAKVADGREAVVWGERVVVWLRQHGMWVCAYLCVCIFSRVIREKYLYLAREYDLWLCAYLCVCMFTCVMRLYVRDFCTRHGSMHACMYVYMCMHACRLACMHTYMSHTLRTYT